MIRQILLSYLLGAFSLTAAQAQDVSLGERIFQSKADCKFCHGESGDGGGDPQSPGQPENLRMSILKRAQMIEVVACGRPATEMPHFDKDAYGLRDCYGLSAEKLGKDMPPDPATTSLTQREIEAVVDYVLAVFVSK